MDTASISSNPANQPNSSIEAEGAWKDAFVPKTSSWGEKPLCVDKFDENQNCCVSGYSIEAVVDQAYEDGFGKHPGVKAIDGAPCVNAADLETLVDELVAMGHIKRTKNNDKITIPGLERKLDLDQEPYFVSAPVVDFCKDLVKSVIEFGVGKETEIPQKKILGDKFRKAVNYCGEALSQHFEPIEIYTNNFRKLNTD